MTADKLQSQWNTYFQNWLTRPNIPPDNVGALKKMKTWDFFELTF